MKRQRRPINSSKPIDQFFSSVFDDNIQEAEDSVLLDSIDGYMKGRLDIEEVKNDPGLPGMQNIVKEMISDYNRNRSKSQENEKFIRDAFSEIPDERLLDEISSIKYELNNSKINDISAEWVKEWHEKRQKTCISGSRREEIKEFIVNSLESDEKETRITLTAERNIGKRTLLIRYVSLSAAAVLGAFLMIKTLVPASGTENLFDKYYEPFNAVSPVTRSLTDNSDMNYQTAIENYKKGNYQSAALGFSNAISAYPSNREPLLYLGITEVELDNYDKAIAILSDISGSSGEYGKEAKWYLGLTYLKTGDKDKAYECFKMLSQRPGYYCKRSEKILRRIK